MDMTQAQDVQVQKIQQAAAIEDDLQEKSDKLQESFDRPTSKLTRIQ